MTVGTGLIAQVMHLHYLTELDDRFEIAAVCDIAADSARACAERYRIGVDRIMWGADYPHLEGAAPVHRETLRYIFGGMPEEDIRRILGANACDLWGLDGDMLQSVADRVGPTVADLATPLALAEIEDTFSWSLARPVPLLAGGA